MEVDGKGQSLFITVAPLLRELLTILRSCFGLMQQDGQHGVGMMIEDFVSTIQHLVGKKCWGFVAGEGTGSVVALDFGDRMKRDKPLRNPHLTREQRENSAELSLLVQCVWRLDSSEQVICGAWDSNVIGGPMLAGLQRVVGKDVCSVVVDMVSLDLTLWFDAGLCLKIFCDRVNVDEDEDNYSFHVPARTFVVGTRSRLSIEPRK